MNIVDKSLFLNNILFSVGKMQVKYPSSIIHITYMKRVQICYSSTFDFGQVLKRLIVINVGSVYALAIS